MDYNAYSFVMDFAFMSLLLVAAQFLRAKIKFLQTFYIPAPVIAGVLGLILGPQILNWIPWSAKIGSYALISIIEVFIMALTPQLAVAMGCSTIGAIELLIGIALLFVCARIFGVYRRGKKCSTLGKE